MSAEKFYRNIAIKEVWPTKVVYPDTVVEARTGGQSDLFQRCNLKNCYFWVVASEKEFFPQEKILLPLSYLPWGKKIPLSDFKLVAFVGKISKKDYRRVLSLVKANDMRLFRVEQIVKNPRVAKILEMYYLGIPLAVRVRPVDSGAYILHGWLHISIKGNLEGLEFFP